MVSNLRRLTGVRDGITSLPDRRFMATVRPLPLLILPGLKQAMRCAVNGYGG
jgi:hypothetical protein